MNTNTGSLTPNELSASLGGITIQGVYRALKAKGINTIIMSNRRKYIPSMEVRRLFEDRGFKYPKQNISFQIVKGGVGKTSLSFSLATRASHYGARVLVIDFDQQSNLTRSFNIDARNKPVWINIARDNIQCSEALISVSDSLDLIPSNLNNSRLDIELTQSASNLKDMVRDAILPIRDNYDFVIMDCPPAINKINTAVTCGSDMILIPINPDPYAMDGLEFSVAELLKVKKDFKLNFDYKIIWNRYDARERLGALYMHRIIQDENKINKILPIVIRTDVTLKNAVFDSKTIFEIPKKSFIREDIDQFTKEILGINEWNERKASME
jgi:chromosome partitioning protein